MVRYKFGASSPYGHLRDISINFLCDLYGKKIISDNQRAKNIYPF